MNRLMQALDAFTWRHRTLACKRFGHVWAPELTYPVSCARCGVTWKGLRDP